MENLAPPPKFGWRSALTSELPTAPASLRDAIGLIALLAGVLLVLKMFAPPDFVVGSAFYLPLHSAAEVFAVIVSAMVFGIGWHSFDGKNPQGVMVLSSAFLAIGLLDLGHLLSFPGMPDFVTPSGISKTLSFWLAARAIGAAALLFAALLPWTSAVAAPRRYAMPAAATALAGLIYWLILFHPSVIPQTFIQGEGLTAFKKNTEYLLIAVYASAAGIMLMRMLKTSSRHAVYLFTAASIMVLSELCFTLYSQFSDSFNGLGHIYKVIAYLCLYRAIFVEGVHQPYQRLSMSERSLRSSERSFRSLMEFAPDAILLMDGGGRISMMNARAEMMFGRTREAMIGTRAEALIPGLQAQQARLEHGDDGAEALRRSFEITCRHGEESSFPAEISLGRLHAHGGSLQIAIVRDVSERKHLEAVLLDQATHDALTGLPNRALALDKLRQAIAHARGHDTMLAVIFLGIDHFKRINEIFGHASGDEVLRQAVRRLAAMLSEGDMLARQGGDQFIVLRQKIADMQEVTALGEQLQLRMREPFYVAGKEIFLSASLGVSVFPHDEHTEEGLLHNADMAMNSAKTDGRNGYRMHTSDMDQSIRERMEMESYLRYAVERNELLLHYQPRVSFGSGAIIGMEALVRWSHPTRGLIPPLSFIPVAEESGLIEEIGLWVLRTACVQARSWAADGLPGMSMSVNLSARQFLQPRLAQQVQAVLEETGFDPACLELEITESTVMHDTESAIKTLRSLKELGVVLSIDDFGTGHSSLSYLKLFPIDILKIDRSFVKDVIDDPNDAAITRAIVGLAHSLELDVVAEGVETEAQAVFLKACGCDEMQGYYFSRPVPADELAAMLRQRESGPARMANQVAVELEYERGRP